MNRKSKRRAAWQAALPNRSDTPSRFRLTATDLAINARAQVVLWEVCRAVGATGKGGEPNENALCLWGHRSLAEVSRTDLEARAGCVGTGLLFSGYYAAMNQLSKMASEK